MDPSWTLKAEIYVYHRVGVHRPWLRQKAVLLLKQTLESVHETYRWFRVDSISSPPYPLKNILRGFPSLLVEHGRAHPADLSKKKKKKLAINCSTTRPEKNMLLMRVLRNDREVCLITNDIKPTNGLILFYGFGLISPLVASRSISTRRSIAYFTCLPRTTSHKIRTAGLNRTATRSPLCTAVRQADSGPRYPLPETGDCV